LGQHDVLTGILRVMTEMLDMAVAKLAALPPEEQDRIAQWLLQELPDAELWDRRFSETQDALRKLAAETRKERAAGNANELEPEKL
jgi:hypothetical protein